ncbi:MAG: hypothetical protein HeimC2_33760 [Candidatus Heimdallarchaeota archaeon LC_2]|nr:MAG: hypothetical protein HeimC2_33760 [Candidatus Heimdallarchaeota archaeon LC_2]
MTNEGELVKISLSEDLDDLMYRAIMEGKFEDESSLIPTAVEELLYMEISNPEELKNKNRVK